MVVYPSTPRHCLSLLRLRASGTFGWLLDNVARVCIRNSALESRPQYNVSNFPLHLLGARESILSNIKGGATNYKDLLSFDLTEVIQ